jgi:hypothetical protein
MVSALAFSSLGAGSNPGQGIGVRSGSDSTLSNSDFKYVSIAVSDKPTNQMRFSMFKWDVIETL